MITLSEGFEARPLVAGDIDGMTAVVAACELADDGIVEIDADDIASEWNRPGFDPATDTLGVFLGSTLVAFAEVYDGRSDTDVHPEWRGRGIGTALMRWTWDRVRAMGRSEIGQTVPDVRTDAVDLFRSNGYEPRWTSWILQIDLDAPLDPPSLPAAFSIRDYTDADERAVYEVVERAFNEWPGRDPSSFEAWRAVSVDREAFSRAATPVLIHDGAVAGVAVAFAYAASDEGWVHQLAVAREHRGLGLGRALLQDAFRRVYDGGRRRCGLATDSRTGALGVYEAVGMKVRRSYTRYAKPLG